ncbi:MAG: hypothetical protein GC150_11055 [Rhizobiales bacterium]|nr:hypothetical protein [Hyphomicrobiales bacterium]
MNTQTHVALAAAILARPLRPRENMAVLAGGIVPDLAIYVLFIWARLIAGIPEATLWREVYWQEPWQTLLAVANSVPLYVVLVAAGAALGLRALWLFGAAALIHLVFDFFFHADDAHRHFWPLSDWRFHSPLSYWDSRYYGDYVALGELALGVAALAVLWGRFGAPWVRGLVMLALLGYVAVPVYFTLALG